MSSSFKHIPVKDLPRSLFYRHVAIVVVLGLVLILVVGLFALWLTTATGLRAAQQEGVRVQMAASRVGQKFVGLGQDPTSADAASEALSTASEKGTLEIEGYDRNSMQATRLTFDDGAYRVDYDAHGDGAHWTVTAHLFSRITAQY